jgi:ABC-type multidrug transport system ATPase subunit
VKSFSWEDVTVTVKDRVSKEPIDLLSNVSGMIEAGEMMALMGPRYVQIILTQTMDRHLT